MTDTSAVRDLTEIIGADVIEPDGRVVGRVKDLSVTVGSPSRDVGRVVVRLRSGGDRVFGWSSVHHIDDRGLHLASAGAPTLDDIAEPPTRILLGRDVLDTQVVDLHGHRVERVGDVLLVDEEDGALTLVAVDVGFGAVLRRIGLRRLAARMKVNALSWDQLHLTSRRGHVAQIEATTSAVHRLDGTELARLVETVSTQHAADILSTVPSERAVVALLQAHPDVARRVMPILDAGVAQTVQASLPERVPERFHQPLHSRRRWQRHRTHRPQRSSAR